MTYIPPKNLTSLTKMFEWANSVTDASFASIGVIMFSIIIFMGALPVSKSPSQSLTFAAFFGMLAAMFFGFLGLVSGQTFLIYSILIAVGVVWMRFENRN